MFKHILVATDGSKLSDKAVKQAIGLAAALKARLTALHVVPEPPEPTYFGEEVVYRPISPKEYAKQAGRAAEAILAPVCAKANAAGVECDGRWLMDDAPWEAIIAAARKAKADLIVMASHGRRGPAALLLGSEAQKVLTHSKLPVLVVR